MSFKASSTAGSGASSSSSDLNFRKSTSESCLILLSMVSAYDVIAELDTSVGPDDMPSD